MVTAAPVTLFPSFVTVTFTSAFFASSITRGFVRPVESTVSFTVLSAYPVADAFTPL